jgi:hypothetical protein
MNDLKLYRFVVGLLQYATINRPEIGILVNKVSQLWLKLLMNNENWLKGSLDTTGIIVWICGTRWSGMEWAD